MKTKHTYMFSYSAKTKDGNLTMGRYTFTGEEILHLLADTSNGDEFINAVENKLEEQLSLVHVVVMGITKLPMRVKR